MKFVVMSAMFVCVASSAWAQTGEACSLLAEDTERLICYDGLFKKKTEKTVISKWLVDTEKSKMDDSATINLSLTGDKLGAQINIRCEERVTSIYLTMGGAFMADIQDYGIVRYRIDAEKSKSKTFEVSTDNEALGLWSGGASVPFIKQLLGHTKLIAQITAYNESPSTIEWDISGIDEEIKPLRKQCGW